MSGRQARGVGLAAAIVAFVVFAIDLGRPAFWQDEAFTVELTRRSWGDLGSLIYHTEAPLGPYYLVMKPWLAVSDAQWWARLPTALASAVAVGLLACFVTRVLRAPAGVATAAIMTALPGVSRYAQEVRPYAFAMLFAVVSSIAWWYFVQRGGWRRGVWLAITVAALPAAHLFALAIVPGMALAAPFAVPAGRRLRALWLTVVAVGSGVVIAAAFIVLVIKRAVGVAHPRSYSVDNVWLTITELFGQRSITVVVMLLAAVGVVVGGLMLVMARPGARRRGVEEPVATGMPLGLLVYAVTWAVVPFVVMAVSSREGQKTLIPRYFISALPGWCVLAGFVCGAATLAVRRHVGTVAAIATLLVPIVLVAASGFPVQDDQRERLGHGGGDVRPLIALLRSPGYEHAAVVVPKVYMIAQVEAYGPDLVRRMPLRVDPAPSAALVHVTSDSPRAVRALRAYSRVAIVAQGDAALALDLSMHIPGLTSGYRRTALTSRDGWTLVTLDRSPAP